MKRCCKFLWINYFSLSLSLLPVLNKYNTLSECRQPDITTVLLVEIGRGRASGEKLAKVQSHAADMSRKCIPT